MGSIERAQGRWCGVSGGRDIRESQKPQTGGGSGGALEWRERLGQALRDRALQGARMGRLDVDVGSAASPVHNQESGVHTRRARQHARPHSHCATPELKFHSSSHCHGRRPAWGLAYTREPHHTARERWFSLPCFPNLEAAAGR